MDEDVRFARKIARWWQQRYPRPWLLAEDAEGVACEGLFIAARTFDAAAGASWETWRARKVKGQLFDLVRQARHLHGDADLSLDLTVTEEDGVHIPLTLGDTIPAEEPPIPPEDRCDLRAALASIGPRDRFILRLIFEDGRTLTEVGARLGLSTERAFQLKKRALNAMREAM